MKFAFIRPTAQLQPYISSYWAFESSSGIPITDSRIIVPNGKARIIIPYKNSLSVIVNNKTMESKGQDILLSGIWDIPTTFSSYAKDIGTIGIDLTPKGLYHLFKLNMYEIANRLFSFEDLFGRWGKRIQYLLGEIKNPQEKVAFIQNSLIYLLSQNTKDYSLLDFLVDTIIESQGMVEIKALEERTGYTKRYLDILFKEHIGASPKLLASIMRFQKFYKLWAQDPSKTFFKDDLYAYYYDQSHFIKEFKRFTGYTPQSYTNEFSRSYYAP